MTHSWQMLPLLASFALAACGEDSPEPTAAPVVNQVQPSSQLVAANSWVIRRGTLLPARAGAVAGTINGIIYLVGGYDGQGGTGFYAYLDAYDVAANTWSRKKPHPVPRGFANGATAIGGKLYVTGGEKPTCTGSCTTFLAQTMFVYNPANDTWTRKKDMPFSGASGAQGVIGGKLYVYLGAANSPVRFSHAFVRYNPATDSWARLATPPINHPSGVGGVINGKFYLAGGHGGRDDFRIADLHVYDPATNTWSTKTPLSHPRQSAFGGVINGKLYVAGGFDDFTDNLLSTEVYDPATNKWTDKADMQCTQGLGASAVASGRLYAIGGADCNTFGLTRNLQFYTP